MSAPRRALVTGASRGIGRAIALDLAAQGHEVVVACRADRTGASDVVDRIRGAGGIAQVACFDVTDREATRAELAALDPEARPFQIVVHNAGVSADAPFPAMSAEAWELPLRTSLDGFYNVVQPLVMPMLRTRWGRIVIMSSVSGVVGNRGQVNYAAAKAGLVGAARSLALEVAKRNVTVNVVAPGLIETDMTASVPREEVLPRIPMRRFGSPEEVAAVVGFLASSAAAYVTGQVIGVNGGLA
jgi:3-oxoacyl-[acyl-carrier protein] reductase